MAQISSNAARAADILLALGEAGPEGLSLQTLSQQLDEAKPAVHRGLSALALKGFVESAGRRGHYRLGPAIYGLVKRASRIEGLVARMRPALMDISARFERTAYLMARSGYDAVCVETHNYGFASNLTGGAGGRVPLGIPAGSLALLATLPEATARQVVTANAQRYENYPTLRPLNGETVYKMASEARELGYAYDFDLYFPNEGGIGVPVETGLHGEVELSISIGFDAETYSRSYLDWLAAEIRSAIARLDGADVR